MEANGRRRRLSLRKGEEGAIVTVHINIEKYMKKWLFVYDNSNHQLAVQIDLLSAIMLYH